MHTYTQNAKRTGELDSTEQHAKCLRACCWMCVFMQMDAHYTTCVFNLNVFGVSVLLELQTYGHVKYGLLFTR